jgi:cytochrome c2
MKPFIKRFIIFTLFIMGCRFIKQPNQLPKTTVIGLIGIDTSNNQIIIDLVKMEKNKAFPKLDTIFVQHDPEFKGQAKRYIGFRLTDLLKTAIARYAYDTTNAIVHFECFDGYTPTMPLPLVLDGKNTSYVVLADLDAKKGSKWVEKFEKFDPYYLVWQDYVPQNHTFVYPYALVKIKIRSFSKQFKNIYPYDNPNMVQGFNLFSQTCLKCHSLNKVGGEMGPELNYPQNITEYWDEKHIVAFAKDSKSFRINSKMPPITDLKDEDFVEIIKYLKYMANHKQID